MLPRPDPYHEEKIAVRQEIAARVAKKERDCPRCGGEGVELNGPDVCNCDLCDGTGKIGSR